MTHSVAVDDIVAVHANAHYTYIFTGSAKLFCPLAIGDVELRLDGTRFARVHRSHIVNLDRVVGLKRSGDDGLVELAAPDRYSVPVTRSRVAGSRLGSGRSTIVASCRRCFPAWIERAVRRCVSMADAFRAD